MDFVSNFVCYQTNLRKIELSLFHDDTDTYLLKKLIFLILQYAPMLRHFQIHFKKVSESIVYSDIQFDVSEYERFITLANRLESIVLDFNLELQCSLPENFHDISPSTVFTRLKKIRLCCHGNSQILFDLIIRCCVSLEDLFLKTSSYEVMIKIFEAYCKSYSDEVPTYVITIFVLFLFLTDLFFLFSHFVRALYIL